MFKHYSKIILTILEKTVILFNFLLSIYMFGCVIFAFCFFAIPNVSKALLPIYWPLYSMFVRTNNDISVFTFLFCLIYLIIMLISSIFFTYFSVFKENFLFWADKFDDKMKDPITKKFNNELQQDFISVTSFIFSCRYDILDDIEYNDSGEYSFDSLKSQLDDAFSLTFNNYDILNFSRADYTYSYVLKNIEDIPVIFFKLKQKLQKISKKFLEQGIKVVFSFVFDLYMPGDDFNNKNFVLSKILQLGRSNFIYSTSIFRTRIELSDLASLMSFTPQGIFEIADKNGVTCNYELCIVKLN